MSNIFVIILYKPTDHFAILGIATGIWLGSTNGSLATWLY